MHISSNVALGGVAVGSVEQVHGGLSQLYRTRLKRLVDVALAVILLPLVAPVVAVLYLLTRRDGGPGFFGHSRIGQNGQIFTCWKIRTMVLDAEAVLARHLDQNPQAAEAWAQEFKLDDDPRVTRLGRFLRASSLDELPQLWNVLCGQMSMVGPRPVTAVELPMYRNFVRSYLSVKPGVTGLWQVSGRNGISYDQRVRMDDFYVGSMSLIGDLSIILRTAMVVLRLTGK